MSCGGDTDAVDLLLTGVVGSYVQIEGCDYFQNTYNGQSTWYNAPLDTALRLRSSGPSLAIYTYLDGNVIRYAIDGVDTGSVTKPLSNVWGWQTIATGLDEGAEHTYLISFGSNPFTAKCLSTGGTGLNTSALAERNVAAYYGDSITAGIAESGDSTLSWAHRVSLALGMQCANRGAGGTGVVDSGQVRTADLTAMSTAPTLIVDMYGINDIVNDVTEAAFYTAFLNELQLIRAGLPTAYILVEAIMYASAFNVTHAKIDAFNIKKSLAVTAMADARIGYSTGAKTSRTDEDLHPAADECVFIATAVAADAFDLMGLGDVSADAVGDTVFFNSPSVTVTTGYFDATVADEYVMRFVFPRRRTLIGGE